MALDGLFLSCLRREMEEKLRDSRVDKIFQPSREELIFLFRSREGVRRLYLSVRAGAPRLHFTEMRPDNPAQPPMLCMLLRRRLTGGRFVAVRQEGLERALYLDFDCVNELGDVVRLTFAAELMGKHSNGILIDQNGRVVDAMKRVDLEMSAVRPILPGAMYDLPPALPNRLDVSQTPADRLIKAVTAAGKPLSEGILEVTCGLSPLLCREIAVRTVGDGDLPSDALDDTQRARLRETLEKIQAIARGDAAGRPWIVYREDQRPLAFSCLPLLQYGPAQAQEMDSFSALLDAFYAEREQAERFRQRTSDLSRLLTVQRDRLGRKLAAQREELRQSGNRDRDRLFADLINANPGAIPRGAESARLINYYAEDCAEIEVPLDPALSAAANAQKYYKAYRKAQTAQRVLAEQIEKGESEQQYLDSVADALSRAESAAEIDALRQELIDGGYLRAVKKGRKAPSPLKPKAFLSDDGFTILVGRNNVENDRLTTKTARGADIWLHTKNIPGSHVIILTDGKTPPDRTLEQAAILAALHSKASASRQVPVDYTFIRHVHKPAGAKPGFVIYEQNRTAYVDPDPALAQRLAQTEEG